MRWNGSIIHLSVSTLNSLPAKSRLRSRAEQLERAMLAGRVRPDEYPVLPRGQPAEDFCLRGFVARKTQAGLHARERVGRKAGPLFDRHAHFVFPVEIIWCDRDEAEFKSFFGAEQLARGSHRSSHGSCIAVEAGF